MPAISEYARLTTQRIPLRAPGNLGELLRWLIVALAVYLVLRLISAVLRGFGK
jgi:hypothetical protein